MIQWVVETSQGNVTLDSSELVKQLVERSMKDQRIPHEELVRTFIDYLEEKRILSKCSSYELALMALDLGYFYKIFLTQNKVTTNATDEHGKTPRVSPTVPGNT
jgi:hypothetical protein